MSAEQLSCLACEKAGVEPQYGERVVLEFNPRVLMPGPPTVQGTRLGAEFLADANWATGIAEAMDDYRVTREQVLVACWWAGIFREGRGRKWYRDRYYDWALMAQSHLWYGCINFPDPPWQGAEGGRA